MSKSEVSETGPATSAALVSVERNDSGRRLTVSCGEQTVVLHPFWLRERTCEAGALDATNLQRLYDANDLDYEVSIEACAVDNGALSLSFSDGYEMSMPLGKLIRELGWEPDPESLPAREAWTSALSPFPYAQWAPLEARDPVATEHALGNFWRYGFFVLRDVPTEAGTLRKVAQHLGNLVPTNFGEIFDVVTEVDPTDLAYTPIHLNAHSDGPYRKPVPSIQMLHCLTNETSGGYSTLVDGFGASQELAVADPEAYRALTEVDVDFRYDMVVDVIVNRSHILELDEHREFKQIRFSHRLDYVTPADPYLLDSFYRGRRWLRDRMNDPVNQVKFLLEPGDVMIMDNHRLLHGRTAFDASEGRRHLQGCYIDYDGPDAYWRLARRQQSGTTGIIAFNG